jgi:hypothetical protein
MYLLVRKFQQMNQEYKKNDLIHWDFHSPKVVLGTSYFFKKYKNSNLNLILNSKKIKS